MRSSEFDTVHLYRGDAAKVEQFSTEKTRNSIGLLFGMGIYLTDNPRIALDYTVKGGWSSDGSGTVLLRDQEGTEQNAIRSYLLHIINKELGWPQYMEEFKEKAVRDWYQNFQRPQSSRWDNETGKENAEHTAYDKAQKEYQDQHFVNMRKEFGKFLTRAKRIYKQRLPDLRFFQDTLGQWTVVKKEHAGVVTTFEVPRNYCERTIHGDRPMTPEVLELVRAFINSETNGGRADFRNFANDKHYPFDEWIEVFKKEGSRYAWREDHIGGKGENPTLDEVMNGTHGGFSIFYRSMDPFIAACREKGYTGIEYDGGVRIGGNVRGGGGIRHQSFVFWDDDYINGCRVEEELAQYPEANSDTLGKIRAGSLPLRMQD